MLRIAGIEQSTTINYLHQSYLKSHLKCEISIDIYRLSKAIQLTVLDSIDLLHHYRTLVDYLGPRSWWMVYVARHSSYAALAQMMDVIQNCAVFAHVQPYPSDFDRL